MSDDGSELHHFDFDLDRGIRVQVVEKLDASPYLPLKKGCRTSGKRNLCSLFQGQARLHRQGFSGHHQEQAYAAQSAQ